MAAKGLAPLAEGQKDEEKEPTLDEQHRDHLQLVEAMLAQATGYVAAGNLRTDPGQERSSDGTSARDGDGIESVLLPSKNSKNDGGNNATPNPAAAAATTATTTRVQPVDSVDMRVLLRAVSAPLVCVGNCVEPTLAPGLEALLRLHQMYSSIGQMCSGFNDSVQCIERRLCPFREVFDIGASGLHSLCSGRKREFLANNQRCLDRWMDPNAQYCEALCHFVQAVGNLSRLPELQPNSAQSHGMVFQVLVLVGQLGGVCRSAECFLPCFRDKMNSNCEHSGGIITDALLHPFYRLVGTLENAPQAIQRLVIDKLPAQCDFLLSKASLDGVRNRKTGHQKR